MRIRVFTTLVTVAALLVATPSWARQHVVDPATLQQAITDQRAVDAANRQVVERVLARAEVADVAARMGIDLKDARSAIAGLSSEDLAAIAQPAQAAEADLAGGQRTIVISVTTLLLIIIIVLLIAN
jgi:sugar diacid utilization regulator